MRTIHVLGVVLGMGLLFGVILALTPQDDARQRDVQHAAAAARPTRAAQRDPRVHAESSFPSEVEQLIESGGLDDVATRARAYHNDVEIWVNRQATALIESRTCDQQRDYAASLWITWSQMSGVPASGAGVTIKSYTGRVIASAEQGSTGPRFHC